MIQLTVWGIHSQIDGNGRDVFIGARDPIGFVLDLFADLADTDDGFGVR